MKEFLRDGTPMPRVLVTGATGFIGGHLCTRLALMGAEVYGVSRKPPAEDTGTFHWRQVDMVDSEMVYGLIRSINPQYIFHLAGSVTGSRARELVLPILRANLLATVNLLSAVTEVGCSRLVLAGSLEEPSATESEPVPCSPYAASKWSNTGYARMFHALYGTPVVVARIFMTYGPSQPDLTKLIPYVTLSLLKEESPRLGSGVRLVDWIYVEDVVDGLIAMMRAPGVEGRVLDLGSGVLTSIREIVQQLTELVGSQAAPSFGKEPDRPLEMVRAANLPASRRALTWSPSVPLGEGLRVTVDWYRRLVFPTHTGASAGAD